MITIEQYFQNFPHEIEHHRNALDLLEKVNRMLEHAIVDGINLQENPVTKSYISGSQYGGYRPENCPIGAKGSAHKIGKAVDIYDPENLLDGWLNDGKLEKFGLYREHPDYTKGWLHAGTKSPASGKRTFIP